MKNRIYIESMGCERRALDAALFRDYFTENGFRVVGRPRKGDWILFITCAFRKINEDIAVDRIDELKRFGARLIVGGCLKNINPERLARHFSGPSFATMDNKSVGEIFPDFSVKLEDLPDANRGRHRSTSILKRYLFTLRLDFSFLKRVGVFLRRVISRYYYIRISSGCIDRHCTYCVIWRAVGKLASKPLETCVREMENGVRRGYRNIVLIADNTGAYGLDRGLTFPDLIHALQGVEGKYRIMIEEFHPYWLIRYAHGLAEEIRKGRIKSLDCTVQSGSNRVLKLMNRGHTKEDLRKALIEIREACPELRMRTDILVGFPSETEEEFEETLRFVRELDVELVLIYGYSRNPYLKESFTELEIRQDIIENRIERAVKFFRRYGIACSTA